MKGHPMSSRSDSPVQQPVSQQEIYAVGKLIYMGIQDTLIRLHTLKERFPTAKSTPIQSIQQFRSLLDIITSLEELEYQAGRLSNRSGGFLKHGDLIGYYDKSGHLIFHDFKEE
jgi:hypothetical protein